MRKESLTQEKETIIFLNNNNIFSLGNMKFKATAYNL